MSAMDTDEVSVVLPSTTTSGLTLSLHPLPILNISEHLTRLKLQKNTLSPFVLGALLGTQAGREVEIVNTFELAVLEDNEDEIDEEFLFTKFCSTPLLLVLQPNINLATSSVNAQTLPFKAYEPSVEIRERTSRSVFIEVPYNVETGEAERIAVDWTARGGGTGTSLESHLQTQRSAVKMLHERILVLVKYITDVIAGQAKKDHATLRSFSALIASLPATENKAFRDEFSTEYADVQLTAVLSSLTKSANILNDLVDKHMLFTSGREAAGRRRGMGRQGGPLDWDRHH
ncbi:hypothetical protein C0991_008792 [Blastosporella zonata]|nr:hypothetical protein C0991_008792 [Blastosporella zonata]